MPGYPQYILTKAAELNDDNEMIEQKFFSLYDKILNYWFPPTEGYDVCPQWPVPNAASMEDFAIPFVIEHHQHPLLLLVIKPPSDFGFQSGRNGAVLKAFNFLDDIGPNNQHADRLYAISAIGKRWRACYTLKGKNSESGRFVTGVTTKSSLRSPRPEYWNPDITSEGSWEALKGIVDTIKGQVSQ